jgi:hypothetical protein
MQINPHNQTAAATAAAAAPLTLHVQVLLQPGLYVLQPLGVVHLL